MRRKISLQEVADFAQESQITQSQYAKKLSDWNSTKGLNCSFFMTYYIEGVPSEASERPEAISKISSALLNLTKKSLPANLDFVQSFEHLALQRFDTITDSMLEEWLNSFRDNRSKNFLKLPIKKAAPR